MDGSYISMAMRVHRYRRDRYVIGVHVSSLFESSHSNAGDLGWLRIAIGPLRDDQARNRYVREFTFLRKASPGGLDGRRERFSPLLLALSWRTPGRSPTATVWAPCRWRDAPARR